MFVYWWVLILSRSFIRCGVGFNVSQMSILKIALFSPFIFATNISLKKWLQYRSYSIRIMWVMVSIGDTLGWLGYLRVGRTPKKLICGSPIIYIIYQLRETPPPLLNRRKWLPTSMKVISPVSARRLSLIWMNFSMNRVSRDPRTWRTIVGTICEYWRVRKVVYINSVHWVYANNFGFFKRRSGYPNWSELCVTQKNWF